MASLAEMADATGEKKDINPNDVFQLTEKLGEGSYGSVFKGIHKETSKNVAVKMVPVDGDFDDIAKEIRILKKCDSVYVVKYYGSYSFEDNLWIVMEYCGGGAVLDLMEITEQTLSEGVIQQIIGASLLGLAYLHKNKNVHRDIKSGNILLTEDGQAKLADFGVSAQLQSTMSKQNTVIGTPYWMAPEIIQEKGYDGKADLWSLGITIIEMAEGEPPLHKVHPMRAIFMIPTKPPPTFTHPEDYSEEMRDFLKLCLVKDPTKRSGAADLLTHPWVAPTCKAFEENQGSSTLLAQLVEHSMEAIQAFREKEEEDSGSGSGSDSSDDEPSNSSSGGSKTNSEASDGLPPTSDDWDSGTMVMTKPSGGGGDGGGLPPTSDDWDSGTMVMTKPSSGGGDGGGLPPTSEDWDSGTMVMTKPSGGGGGGGGLPPTSDDWDSGTMVMTKPSVRTTRGDYDASGTLVMTGGGEEEEFDSGTMVMTSPLAQARQQFEKEEAARKKKLYEGKESGAAGGSGGALEETAYGNYLNTKAQHQESLNKIDDDDEKADFLRNLIEQEEKLFASVQHEHQQSMKSLQSMLDELE